MEPAEEISNEEIIRTLESPVDHQNWFLQKCEDEFRLRNISSEEIETIATALLISEMRTYLETQEYYKNPHIIFSSRFLNQTEVKKIYANEFRDYVENKKSLNSHLPTG